MARYLIDSHIFLWARETPERLLAGERDALADSANEVAVSAATIWELSIKMALGRLTPLLNWRDLPQDYFARSAAALAIPILPVEAPEAEHVRTLPPIHDDPFDRLLIAQALIGGWSIMTRDEVFGRYPGVRVFSGEA